MARTRRNRKNLRGKTRRQRGGGGCFGGICKPNKAANMKVEQPGQPPEEKVINYTNPLHMAALEKEIAEQMKQVNRFSKAMSKPLKVKGMPSNAELNAELAALEREYGMGSAGTGIGPGAEVNTNADLEAELNRIMANVGSSAQGEGQGQGQGGGGGCLGGLCFKNKNISQVELPGTVPANIAVVNPMMASAPITPQQKLERLQAVLQTLKTSLLADRERIQVTLPAEAERYKTEARNLVRQGNRERATHKMKMALTTEKSIKTALGFAAQKLQQKREVEEEIARLQAMIASSSSSATRRRNNRKNRKSRRSY